MLTGASACGSSEETANDPDQTPAAAGSTTSPTGSDPTGAATSDESGDQSDDATDGPVAGATASDNGSGDGTADGVAPASITIESPEDGHQVGNTLSVSGTANSPEANVPWHIDSPIDGILVSGFATADGWLDQAYPWSTSIDVGALQPGTYTFTAQVDDDSKREGTTPPSATITFVKK